MATVAFACVLFSRADAATVEINFGNGFNDSTPAAPVGGNSGTTLGEQRRILFQAAADIWGAAIDSDVPITVQADFAVLQCMNNMAVLGSAGPASLNTNPALMGGNVFYPRALEDALTGSELDPGQPDITSTFNSQLDAGTGSCGFTGFYYGLDGNSPVNRPNLFATVLHELAHGLGFVSTIDQGSANPQRPPNGSFQLGLPSIFDVFIFDLNDNQPWTSMTNAARLASSTDDPNVVLNGPTVTSQFPNFVNQGTNGGRMRLDAPGAFLAGSSISHFSRSASPDLLMEPVLSNNLAVGQTDLTLALLQDLGYQINSQPSTNELTVTRAGAGSGTVTSSPAGIQCGATCNANFTTGTPVTLTAVADGGSAFDGWSGDCNASGQVTLTTDRSCTATFSAAPATQTLTVTLAGNGFGSVISTPGSINCGLTCMDSFATGTQVTLIATEEAGSLFAGWTGDCNANGQVTISIDRSCTATFVGPPTTQTLTIIPTGSGAGTVTSNPTGIDCGADCSEVFDTGTIVTLTQVAAPGSVASGFTGPADCADGQVTMNTDLTCGAVFETVLVPKLRIEPAELDFVGFLTRPLTLFNDGPGELAVQIIALECTPAPCPTRFSIDPPLGTSLAISPGTSEAIDVIFDPFSSFSIPGEHLLVLLTNDPGAATVGVPVSWFNPTRFEDGFEDISATPAPLFSTLRGDSGLQVGETSQWSVETLGVDLNPIVFDYIWGSSNPAVATVSVDGLVTGTGLGSSLISAVGAKPGTNVVAVRDTVEVVGPPVNLVVTSSVDRLKFGETFAFAVEVLDANNNPVNAEVSWSSNDTAIATVDENGLVTGIDAGITSINFSATAFGGAVVGTSLVLTVEGPPVRLAFFSQTSTLRVGQTFQFVALAFDAIDNPVDAEVTWTTSNSTIASVDNTGFVTALAPGNITIGVGTPTFGATVPLAVLPVQPTLNQPPSFASAAPSDEDIGALGQHYADNFVVQDPTGEFTITEIEFWGIYFHTETPQPVDDFNINIREQASGLPFTGTPVFQEIGTVVPRSLTGTNTTTSQGSAATYKYVFTLSTPVTLPNGTYWIEILNDTRIDDDDNWAWVRANSDPSNGSPGSAFHARFTAWQSSTGDQAVIINGF